MYGPLSGMWGLEMILFSLLFIALIVVGVLLVVRSFSKGGMMPRRPEGNRALDILDERFARGDRPEGVRGAPAHPHRREVTREPPPRRWRYRRSLSAFATTVTLDPAIAAAAHIGVSAPNTASGIITTL